MCIYGTNIVLYTNYISIKKRDLVHKLRCNSKMNAKYPLKYKKENYITLCEKKFLPHHRVKDTNFKKLSQICNCITYQ